MRLLNSLRSWANEPIHGQTVASLIACIIAGGIAGYSTAQGGLEVTLLGLGIAIVLGMWALHNVPHPETVATDWFEQDQIDTTGGEQDV